MSMPALSYGLQADKNIMGTETTPVTLTNSYAGNNAIQVVSGTAITTIYVQYTAQTAGNSIQVKVEGSPDNPDPKTPQGPPVTSFFYQDISTSVAAGTATAVRVEYSYTSLTTGAERFRISFPTADRQMKISIKETVAAGSAGTASVRVLNGPNN
jgi:hypothetical protein